MSILTAVGGRLRIAAAAIATAFGLLSAGSALGATYKVDLSQSSYAPGSSTDISFDVSTADGGLPLPYSIAILAPEGYVLNTGLAPGEVVAADGALTIEARARGQQVALTIPNLGVPLRMVVASPGEASAAAIACTGTATHALTLRMEFDLTGVKQQIPAPFAAQLSDQVVGYVFADPAAGADATAGYSYRLTACLPVVAIPPTSYQGQTITVTIVMTDLEATIGNLFTTPPTVRTSVWSALFAPWNAAQTGPDTQQVAESRMIVGLSDFLTLNAKQTVKPGKTVKVQGTLFPNTPQAGQKVTIWKGSSLSSLSIVATVTTLPTGSFSYSTKAPKKGKLFFLASFGPAGLDVTADACAEPNPAATAGCVNATLGGISSAPLTVSVKKR